MNIIYANMKSIQISLFAIAFLLFSSLGCNKNKDCIIDDQIQGEWVWLKSVGGIGGWTLTPESENITRKLIITDNIYREYVNDSLVYEKKFVSGISEDKLIDTDVRKYIQFESGEKLATKIKDSDLELIEQCIDCFKYYYTKK